MAGMTLLSRGAKVKAGLCFPGRKSPGFTLTELLTVVLAAAVSAAILLPAVSRADEKDGAAMCMSNLKQCGDALLLYANDYDGWIMGNTLLAEQVADRAQRSWGGLLASLGYLEAEISGSGTLPGENVLRCPTAEYRDSIFSTYGMRTTYHADFVGVEGESTTRSVKLADIPDHATKIWLADSLDGRDNTQSNHFDGGFNWGKGGHTSVHLVHTRHEGLANAWFLDGRVEACGPTELRAYSGSRVRYYDAGGERLRVR